MATSVVQRLMFRVSAMLLFAVVIFSSEDVKSNGCTGSHFTVQYSHACGCWQVCRYAIGDCDQIFSIDWDMGDGTTYSDSTNAFSTLPGPCHAYSSPGVYTITMTVVGLCHFSTMTCDITQGVQVTQAQINNAGAGITAYFVADTVCLNEEMYFTNQSSPTGTTWHWDFGDGSTVDNIQNPTHMYDSCGSYLVTLTITSQNICCPVRDTGVIQKQVFVNCTPNSSSNALGDISPYIFESMAITEADTVCEGEPTQFNLTVSDSIVAWLWDFEGIDTSTGQNPAYTFDLSSDEDFSRGQLMVTDTRGCSHTIIQPAVVYRQIQNAPLLAQNDILCHGDQSGSIVIGTVGGTKPYNYQWNHPNLNSPVLSGLSGGNYSLTITDSNQCSFIVDNIAVYEPALFTGVISAQDIDCYGASTGTAVLTVSGGTAPPTFIWEPGGHTGPNISGLTAGTYSVAVTDANGCSFADMVTINQAPELTISITGNDATCGLCDGSATVVASGGSGTYSYLWNIGAVTPTVTDLCAGVYLVEVLDANGCSKSFAVAISNVGGQNISTSKTDVSCYGPCDGAATVNLGGCTGCSISWYDGIGNPIGQTTATIVNLCVGDYFVQVTDGSGCLSFEYVTIYEPAELTGTVSVGPVSCPGQCDGWISVSVSGGTTPYSYQWYDGTGAIIPFQLSPSLFNLCPGSYSLWVADAHGCIITFNATIPSNDFEATTTAFNLFCNGDCTGGMISTINGGAPPFSYQWLDSTGTPISAATNSSISGLCTGTYSLSITDINGCSLTTLADTIDLPSDSCRAYVCDTQNIRIVAGWNIISGYTIPIDPDMMNVFSEILSEILLVKSNDGKTVIPSFGINQIGDWQVEEGYKVKATVATNLIICGKQVDPSTTCTILPAGWSIISYLRNTPMDAAQALSSIADNILLVKNSPGGSYIPAFGINQIGDMLPGQGYKIKMSAPDTLCYPANLKASTATYHRQPQEPIHFRGWANTGHNATIIIPDKNCLGLKTGDEIGVFNQRGMPAGAAVYEDGHLAITVWGDDPTTDAFDGLALRDNFIYRIWQADQQIELPAEVDYESGDKTYQNDGLSVIKKLVINRQEEPVLHIYPNPTDGRLNVECHLPYTDAVRLTLFDVYGQELLRQVSTHSAGKYNAILDLSDFPAGLYICNFKSWSLNRTVKIQKH